MPRQWSFCCRSFLRVLDKGWSGSEERSVELPLRTPIASSITFGVFGAGLVYLSASRVWAWWV